MKLFIKIIIGIILIGLGAALWLNKAYLFSNSQGVAQQPINTKAEPHHENKTVPEVKEVTKKSTNSAADGLSRYYANLRGDLDGKGPQIRNNIIYFPEPDGDLVQLLEERRLVTRPLKKNWTGSTNSHPFRNGETLNTKLSEYTKNNGLELIWWLNRDFIVKSPFRVNKNIIKTSYQVGKAIEGHFENGLSIYFCYQQRVIVLIEYAIPYLTKECLKLPRG